MSSPTLSQLARTFVTNHPVIAVIDVILAVAVLTVIWLAISLAWSMVSDKGNRKFSNVLALVCAVVTILNAFATFIVQRNVALLERIQ